MIRGKIGLGCVTFGREIDRDASFALLDNATKRGVSMLDTASAYGDGASETVIGEWIESRGVETGDLCIATKLLPPYDEESIRESVERSLGRLGVSALDLLYLHSWDEGASSLECLTVLEEMIRKGFVRSLGVSNVAMSDLGHLRELQKERGFTRFSTVQNNFNYAVRDLDDDYFRWCHEEGVDVVTYSPLGAGFLTGKHKRGVETGSRFDVIPGHQDVYFQEESWQRLEQLEQVAKRYDIPQAHLALAWVLRKPEIDCVLIGGRRVDHLEQAFAALEREEGEAIRALLEMGD